MNKSVKNNSHNNNGRKRNNSPRSDRLHEGEMIIRRFMLNQPNSRLGLEPGAFRNTFSGQEYESLRVNVLLWRRGRVYFEDSEDTLPVCKSDEGQKPSAVVESPKAERCGHWNGNGWFVPECKLSAWRFYDGRRCAPLCQETWSFLGVLEDDGLAFWISLKGGSLRSARQFLSMCHEVMRADKNDLLAANAKIVKEVTSQVARHSPNAVLVVVTNPVDAMVYVAHRVSGLETNRVLGQAGVLDTARFRAFLAEAIGCSVKDVSAMLLGGHGDDMVPLPRYASAGGIPISQLLPEEAIVSIVERTRKGGGEIVSLLKTGSAFYAPAAASVQMAEAILRDQKRILPCAAYCDKEYGVGGYFVGVPAVLGAAGCEKIIEVDLTDDERTEFNRSAQHVKDLVATVQGMI